MKMVWHIIKKDLCAIWPLWLAWMGLIAVRIPLLVYFVNYASDRALGVLFPVAGGAMVADVLLVVAIVRSLVHEDALAGDKSFWITRPIAGWHLLAAKLMSALFVCVASPLVLLVPVWIGFGFDQPAIGHVLLIHSLVNAGLVALSLLFASSTRQGSTFWLMLISTIVGAVFVGILGDQFLPASASALERVVAVSVGSVLLLAGFVQQFFRRRTWIAQGTIYVGAVIVALLLPRWPGFSEPLVIKKIEQPLSINWKNNSIITGKFDAKSSLPDFVKGTLEFPVPKEYSSVRLKFLEGQWIDPRGNSDRAFDVDGRGYPTKHREIFSKNTQVDGASVCLVPLTLAANWLWKREQPCTATGFSGRVNIIFTRSVKVADLKLTAGARMWKADQATRVVKVQTFKNAVKVVTITAYPIGGSFGSIIVSEPTRTKNIATYSNYFGQMPLLWILLGRRETNCDVRMVATDGRYEKLPFDSSNRYEGGETHENLGEQGWRLVWCVEEDVGYNTYDLKAERLEVTKE